MSPRNLQKNIIGIRKEDEDKVYELRTPLTPETVAELIGNIPDLKVIVAEGRKPDFKYPRAFSDQEYQAIGATIGDVSQADIIIGVKEVNIDQIIPNKTYLFFSHTHKAQPYNMAMLRKLKNMGCSLVDYELIVEDMDDDDYQIGQGKRQVFFGHMAGYAGALDTLYGLGQRFAVKGIDTPLKRLVKSLDYTSPHGNFGNLGIALDTVKSVGEEIARDGFPESISPVVIGITGSGNVSQASHHIISHLPHQTITVAELLAPDFTLNSSRHVVYCVQINRNDRQWVHFQHILPHLSALIHGAKWDVKQDRLVTRQFLRDQPDLKLEIIGDITCDPNGAIEFTKATYPDNPIYTYHPTRDDLGAIWSDAQFKHTCQDGIQADGVSVMAVTNLPTEFAREASESFSEMLGYFMPELINADFSQDFDNFSIDRRLKRAFILYQGELTPDFQYLEEHLQPTILIVGTGRMSAVVLDYIITQTRFQIIVADSNLAHAQKAVAHYPQERFSGVHEITITPDDVENPVLTGLLQQSDVAISLLPAHLHGVIAQFAIDARTHLVTASYLSDEIKALDERAKDAGVILLNEMGVDPGIDHMSIMAMLENFQAEGKRVKSLQSYCGGVPYQLITGNPLNYKASWSPIGILNALIRPARFWCDGVNVEQSPLEFLAQAQTFIIGNTAFEGYPNGDSSRYIDIYGLHGIETLVRGTLRHVGWSAIFHTLHDLGWFSDQPASAIIEKTASMSLSDDVLATIDWLGIDKMPDEPISAFEHLKREFLSKQDLDYSAGEQDQLIMYHLFEVETEAGNIEQIASELLSIGDVNGHSAMAKTVGLPCAIGACLIARGEFKAVGVQLPTVKGIYQPVLAELAKHGITFEESVL
jgi:alpha-aminoadipic semialdehyde synthase